MAMRVRVTDRLLTPAEAAKLAGCHRNWLYSLNRRGYLPAILTGYGRLYRSGDVLALGERIAARRAGVVKKRGQDAVEATPTSAGDAG